jgi:hypothetical protein
VRHHHSMMVLAGSEYINMIDGWFILRYEKVGFS